MSSFSEYIGIDEQDLKWYHLSACRSMPINWFYDTYETDKELAKQVDQICLHCPVIKQCHSEGVANKEKGVWGGIYMDLGRPDKQHNEHKDPEIMKRLKRLHGKN
jgi:Transcription factor WhiB